ncbi:hypothetical protein llap_6994 [Limosa lapponica baueri]|uniref:Uncharacterized protein n=1 Tax=Limosa lapponica baueri TaxID=1758121 RepID=A0A2I0U9F1_LIMLA|nr:hypothetical protein llap_6994 [Limosa lapponica baueri]
MLPQGWLMSGTVLAALRRPNGLIFQTMPKRNSSPSQTAKTGEFQQFDYGEKNREKNQEKYSQTSPPFYRIEDMTVLTILLSSGEDWVISTAEIQGLLPCIINLIHQEHFLDWNHWDHIWGLDAPQCMYRQMVGLMEKNP